MKARVRHFALRVAISYAAIAFLWIAFSDRLATLIAEDYAHLASFQTAKGFFFVAATTALLYFFSKRQFETIVSVSTQRELDSQARLREKETLLREINHRVKNNLQVILSLMRLTPKDERGFTDLDRKIRSIALAQDLLTSSPDMSSIRARDFAQSLASTFAGGFIPSELRLSGSGDDTALSADAAVAFGILVAEACSNAARYGRSGSAPVSVSVSIRSVDGSVAATVRDDGPGFPLEVLSRQLAADTSLGISLMEALAVQVSGELSLRNEPGATVELRIPRPGLAD
ncbi:MAG TPA: sensor histidine kinase [Spirochaetales bacterium]|nr:sensor histidine kinase [Spirochaetales bacterium]